MSVRRPISLVDKLRIAGLGGKIPLGIMKS